MSTMKPTVRVMLRGGLGNQLFGWAAGTSVAHRLGGRLVLNRYRIQHGDYKNLDPRKFELDFLEEKTETKFHRFYTGLPGTPRPGLKSGHTNFCQIFRESSFAFDPRIDDVRGSVCLDGYFQSWKYFARDQQEIQNRLRIALERPGIESADIGLTSGRPWIAVHVRGGDYHRVGNMHILDKHYYRQSVEYLHAELGKVQLVGFSDDVGVASSVVPMVDHWVAESQTASPRGAMALMGAATGFVGANSTFSWWSAFISRRPQHRNVFPSRWFKSATILEGDLFPQGWRVWGS